MRVDRQVPSLWREGVGRICYNGSSTSLREGLGESRHGEKGRSGEQTDTQADRQVPSLRCFCCGGALTLLRNERKGHCSRENHRDGQRNHNEKIREVFYAYLQEY